MRILVAYFLFFIAQFPLAKADEIYAEPVPPGLHLQLLSAITTDLDSRSANINVMLDDHNLAQGIYAKYTKNQEFEIFDMTHNVFWLRDIETEKGAVLFQERGMDALILQGELNRETQEGLFNLKYLSNGILGKYESCKIKLRNSNGNFYLQNFYNNKRITNVKVITWKFGISTLENVCAPKH